MPLPHLQPDDDESSAANLHPTVGIGGGGWDLAEPDFYPHYNQCFLQHRAFLCIFSKLPQ